MILEFGIKDLKPFIDGGSTAVFHHPNNFNREDMYNSIQIEDEKTYLPKVTVLIGPNNSGKTRFLRALAWAADKAGEKNSQNLRYYDYLILDANITFGIYTLGHVDDKTGAISTLDITEIYTDHLFYSPIVHNLLDDEGSEDIKTTDLVRSLVQVDTSFDYIYYVYRERSVDVLKKWGFLPEDFDINILFREAMCWANDNISKMLGFGGMRLIKYVLPKLFFALDNQLTCVLDNIDLGLHPAIVEKLFDLVYHPDNKSPQLICSVSNPAVLDFLETNQVVLLNKLNNGVELYNLSCIKDIDQEKYGYYHCYMTGAYGGYPDNL